AWDDLRWRIALSVSGFFGFISSLLGFDVVPAAHLRVMLSRRHERILGTTSGQQYGDAWPKSNETGRNWKRRRCASQIDIGAMLMQADASVCNSVQYRWHMTPQHGPLCQSLVPSKRGIRRGQGQGDPARDEEEQAGRGDHLLLRAGIFRRLSQAERMQMR